MTAIDHTRGECSVFTFKEGLLSSVAHDLRLKVGRWSLAWDAAARTLDARFEAASVVVDTVMRDGHPAPGVLDAKDKAKIEKSMREDVLETSRYADIRFRAKGVGAMPGSLAGELELHGKTRPLTVQVSQVGAEWVAEATLHQPDWGVKPYSAMFGTLKVKPDVKVRVSVPASAVPEDRGGG
ncbi:MAG: YceI family protein [Myxococcota bacterium]